MFRIVSYLCCTTLNSETIRQIKQVSTPLKAIQAFTNTRLGKKMNNIDELLKQLDAFQDNECGEFFVDENTFGEVSIAVAVNPQPLHF